ncbi:maleylpyruvate isomerase N-terminal domain-containing protein [Streptomyces sp. NBC_00091]|uniref:maleylpyruvate isomerase N-terminal domain-containing protein n=1 Tax=Streptomyces sp. NBC_00091 TaxID=2975648 RepID=UPI00224D4C56|nr:maleylpyruvate isomerase N-terminal domain-containing protein [Streptomyces sp. NBC_00091]MCX5375384.1 maleylpyruvate isomerase N-terminal domain-containing protein [Streptomyces sp. NBC_00091]
MLDLIEEVTRSGTRITTTLDTLTDADVSAPSALAGWTRGHVITHVAHSIDASRWLLAVAGSGVEPSPRAGSEALRRAVRQRCVSRSRFARGSRPTPACRR